MEDALVISWNNADLLPDDGRPLALAIFFISASFMVDNIRIFLFGFVFFKLTIDCGDE